MSRKITVMGNWKLNGSMEFLSTFIKTLKDGIPSQASVVICPPAIYLPVINYGLIGSEIKLGAQDCSQHLSGAFTGDTSASHLKDVGVSHVLLGHSERRQYQKETDKLIAEKFATAKKVGLTPVLCVGETLEENEAGKTNEVCENQIKAVIEHVGIENFAGAVIAYEPVWAIGTGKSATADDAQAVHKFIRSVLSKYDEAVAEKTSVFYGGSVNASNASTYFAQPDVDGALVGGASLKEEFIDIVKDSLIYKY